MAADAADALEIVKDSFAAPWIARMGHREILILGRFALRATLWRKTALCLAMGSPR